MLINPQGLKSKHGNIYACCSVEEHSNSLNLLSDHFLPELS